MPLSFSQTVSLTCPQCQTPFDAELWLIVDAGEHPALAARCHDGSIHAVSCPNNHPGLLGAPLLYHDRAKKQLFFAYPEGMSEQEVQDAGNQLVEQLRGQMLVLPDSDYLENVQTIPIELLPSAMDDKLDGVLAQVEPPQNNPAVSSAQRVLQEHQTLAATLGEWFNTDSWNASKQFLEAHPELLSNDAELILAAMLDMARAQQDDGATRILDEHREFLRVARANGIDAAFSSRLNPQSDGLGDIPPDVVRLLEKIDSLTRLSDMPRKIELCRAALERVPRDQNPPLWAALLVELGDALNQNPLGERADNLEEAIRHYELALEVYTRAAFPQDWGMTQNNLALAYNQRIRGERADNLEAAIRHYELALEVHTRAAFPQDWAGTQNNLAAAYADRIRGERADNLEEAIRHFELALEVHTRTAFPEQWAGTQNNLASAYADRIRGERADNLEEAIRHFELALEVYTRAAFPQDWGMTQNNLANAYNQRIRGERAENLEDAIRHYELALQVRTRAAIPQDWGMTQNNLALAYSQRIRGERAENLEEAIRHYELALEVRTRTALPQEWAETQNNLANAYSDRIRGERAENLEQAIRHYELALEMRTRTALPQEWAETQNNLANAYNRRIRGERAENLEQAIRHFELALQVRTRTAFPEQWAGTQNNLANAYSQRIRGERADNLEEAIRHFELALEVYTRTAFPEQWAGTQNNLANAYNQRIRGERADNLEAAIRHFELALEVRTRAAFPEDWAGTQNNLAAAYAERIRGERADNLEDAIRHFELALEVYTRAAFPTDWGMTQNNLANAYNRRIRGERAENLEEAIRHYELALEVYTRAAFPEQWAMTQNNLALAYSDRIRGERADNLEEAIRHYELALEVRTRAAFPQDWGMTQNNLALAYNRRIRGERADNLEEAIRHFELALEVRTRAAFPQDWGMTQNNLALAYSQRIRGERAENLEKAIRHYELALEVYTRAAFPEQWATTQNNLALAYRNRIRGERAENLEAAIRHFELALEVRTRAAFPEDWAGTQNNLAAAYAERIRGERAENLEQAIRHFELALEEYTPKRFPERARTTARNLAAVGEAREDWSAVHRALTTAASAGERLFLTTVSRTGEQDEAQELARLYDRDIRACLRLHAEDESITRDALADAEAARSRAFLRQLGLGEFAAPQTVPASLVAREREILAALRDIQNNLAGVDTRGDRMSELERTLTDRRKELGAELERVWDEMLSASPDAAGYVSLRRGDTPKWNHLAALAARVGQDAALVEFHLLDDQTLAFVWRAGWDAPKMLALPLTPERLLLRYLRSYEDEVLNTRRREWARQSGREFYHEWLGLGEELLAPLEPLLGDASLVYFIPHQYLHLLPLHALTVNGEPFIARRAVAYAPSAAVLARVLDASNPKELGALSGFGALVMGYTEHAWQRAVFNGEAVGVAKLFAADAVLDEHAARAALAERAPTAPLIHLSCHGGFDGSDSLASAVLLADGKFTARDWMRLQLRADLVTLSACQLAFSDVNPGDDLVGMTRAILYAGASSVLLALWSVNAVTTEEWMLDFYKRIRANGSPQAKAHAFRDATLALRAEHRDPYIWAPFVLVGNWR